MAMKQREMKQGQGEKQKIGSWLAQPEKRLKFLLGLLFSLTIVFVFLALNSPEGNTLAAKLRAMKQERENKIRFERSLSQDPPIGSPISHFQLDFVPLKKSLVLVVVFGGCEGCGAQSLDDWAKVLGEWETIKREIEGILVIRESEGKVQQVKVRKGWKVKVVADSDGEISKRLNAFFSPRAYGFIDGKLAWVQKRVGMGIVEVLEENLKLAKGEEEAKRILNGWSAEMREKLWGNLPGFKGGDRDERN